MCKPHKATWGNKRELSKRGFGKLRKLRATDKDLKEVYSE